jgi:hypothetical protein
MSIDDMGVGCLLYLGFVSFCNVRFFNKDLDIGELLIVEVGGIYVVQVEVG